MGNRKTILIYIKLILTAIFWGGTFIAGRAVAKDVGPFSAAFFRFAIASSFLFLLIWRIDGKLFLPKKRQMVPVIILGLTGVFTYNYLKIRSILFRKISRNRFFNRSFKKLCSIIVSIKNPRAFRRSRALLTCLLRSPKCSDSR